MDSWLRSDTRHQGLIDDGFLPTRLLEICSNGSIRVVDTRTVLQQQKQQQEQGQKQQPPLRYVALSHRWGRSQHFITTKSNLESRKEGFSEDGLPMTYKDAVIVARRLGFKYIWIDSLCIVQDDEDDWKSESQQMGDVFKHASFTIAAHCADGDNDGFLAKSMQKRSTVEQLGHQGFSLYRRGNLAMDVTASALCKRGWVLQERFMASRTIHFTDSQLFAETSDRVLCEDGRLDPAELWIAPSSSSYSPRAMPQLRDIFGLTRNSSRTARSSGGARPHSVPREWLELVEIYSRCELTRQADKLMAIAGMARKIQSQTDSVWCAGHWSDIIIPSLLWLPAGGAWQGPFYDRAPSWSWAAWDGPIQHAGNLADRCKFLHVSRISDEARSGIIASDTPGGSSAERTTWLDGPGVLALTTTIVSFPNAYIADSKIELGPGPARTNMLTANNRWLGRMELKHFVGVNAIIDRYSLEPVGWICADSPLAWTSASTSGPRFPQRPRVPQRSRGLEYEYGQMNELRFAALSLCGGVAPLAPGPTRYSRCVGLYLVPSGSGHYRRLGVGEISMSYLEGPSPNAESPGESLKGGAGKRKRRSSLEEPVREEMTITVI